MRLPMNHLWERARHARAWATQPPAGRLRSDHARASQRGSVLIIVMWIAFGLVSIALYFGHSMSLELRAADNRVAGLEAEQTIAGAARYVSYVLTTYATNGAVPDPLNYQREAVPVGDASFWLIGRDTNQTTGDRPFFALVDEASKLNLNTATTNMLALLPGMTPELAAAIVDWRDTDSNVTPGGAEDETYARLTPPYKCKNAPFESVNELRLVYGMTLDILFGEDTNLNGVLDANENDGNVSLPNDNKDGRLDAGLLEYVTVHSRAPNTRSDGSKRINVSTGRQQLATLLGQIFGTKRANEILARLGPPTTTFRSLMQFYLTSRMTPEEFAQIAGEISTSNGQYTDGLVNVNTASETVLACLPGIGASNAPTLVSYRQSNPDQLTTIAWVAVAIGAQPATQAGPYITTQSYQFTADVAALGHQGRGYRRVRFIFDTSEGTPKIRYRQDLTRLGWALGSEVRQSRLLVKEGQ